MLNENAKKWVAALRSGNYKQGKSWLRKGDQFCCLGVACELAVEEGVIEPGLVISGGVQKYAGQDSYLPLPVQDWLGLSNYEAVYLEDPKERATSLTIKNDKDCLSFEQIADIIEREPQGLFREPA
jgi:hypothetical protein